MLILQHTVSMLSMTVVNCTVDITVVFLQKLSKLREFVLTMT